MSYIRFHLGMRKYYREHNYSIQKGDTVLIKEGDDCKMIEAVVTDVAVMDSETHVWLSKVRDIRATIIL